MTLALINRPLPTGHNLNSGWFGFGSRLFGTLDAITSLCLVDDSGPTAILTAAQPATGNDLAIARSRLSYLQLPPSDLQAFNPVSLAFLGDAVYELVMRQRHLFPPKRVNDYHQQVVQQVRAEQQAIYLGQLEPYLTAAEQDIARRGRNATPKSRRADPAIYQKATALETLVGYLYLTDLARLETLLNYLEPLDQSDSNESA